MADLSKDKIDKYIKCKGMRCPHCLSPMIEADDLVLREDGIATQIIICTECNRQWQDVYELQGINEDGKFYGEIK